MDAGLRKETVDEIDDSARKRDLKTIEAILFVSGKFLNMKDLIMLSDMNPIIIRELLEDLQESYDKKDSAIQIIQKGEGNESMWKMDVKQEHSHLTTKLATGSAEFSKAEQGTLALIAFKQPIKQSVVIKIRGNKAYEHIKKFSELGLVNKKKQGHTHELSLNDDFYDYFNVSVPETNAEEKINVNDDKPNISSE